MKRFFFLCVAAAILHLTAGQLFSATSPKMIVITHDKKGEKSCEFVVEAALTNPELTRGLMFRNKLGAEEGMLFFFADEAMRSFWMKNTQIPLDIVFINSSFTVVHVHRNAKPMDETAISSQSPAQYVLEVNAGKAVSCRIVPGCTINFRAWSP